MTVLNGHIHQIMQKVEGNVTFHTAMSTAFPQPAPGTAPSPGPMKVADDKLRSLLGITDVTFKRGQQRLAIIDQPLQALRRDISGHDASQPARSASRPRLRSAVLGAAAAVAARIGAGRGRQQVQIDQFTFVRRNASR